jgi:hypothetical protein
MTLPRISPPLPDRSKVDQLRKAAKVAGLKLMPWQETAGQYLMAGNGRWQFHEVCIVVGRQNGKSTILIPRILWGLEHGERIMHTAQNRILPREHFRQVADIVEKVYPSWTIRRANGQEEILTHEGGSYRIVAPTRGGARGYPNDLVIIDELNEMDDWEFPHAARPTLTASKSPQTLYLSTAGEAKSVVLNQVKDRAGQDTLAYLEWSAHPDRDHMDRDGWAEANPALGFMPGMMETLEGFHDSFTLPMFQRECLCQWIDSSAPKLVTDLQWSLCSGQTGFPKQPFMGISVDPNGTRVTAVIAWQADAGIVELQELAHYTGNPVDLDAAGRELEQKALELKVQAVAFDQWTDMALARHLSHAKPLQGAEWANASERFVRAVEGGWLRHAGSGEVSADLAFTVRKEKEGGSFTAVKAIEERPITAALAAVRAVWLASSPVDRKPRVF